MNTEDVTVSLSRLALAKAIKTPDSNEEAEPWTKSVIFYQSHIDNQMRDSLTHPQQQRKGRPMLMNNNNNKQRKPPVNQVRTEDYKRHSYNPLQQQRVPPPQQQQKISSQSTSSDSNRSSFSSGKLAQTTTNNKQGHRYIPSDDEEEEEEDDDEEEETYTETFNHKTTINSTNIPPPAIIDRKGKSKSHVIEPSDDEESESEAESESEEESEDEDKQTWNHETHARKIPSLNRPDLSNSIHRRAKSTSDVLNLPTTLPSIQVDPELGLIDQWRMTVMDSDNVSTPNSTNSFNSFIEDPVIRTPSANSSTATSANPEPTVRSRRSTISEIDMVYLQQQQQHMYNMQLQQAMQYQQAQQMMQIQQYQQALQMQQHQQQQFQQQFQLQQQPQIRRSSMMLDHTSRAAKQNNRRSVSGMDLMIQMEKEKSQFRKNNKKKLPDPSKAKLSTGLLSTVPVQGVHNINFQEYNLKQQKMQKSSISDHQLQKVQNRRSQIMLNEPMPTMSMSTPVVYEQPINNNRQSQYYTNKRQSTYSNLGQYI